jgi:propanol-preferring alcohol dehydrogenase
VSKIGGIVPKSSGFQEGDHVVVVAGWGDGTCRDCQVGNTQICPNVRWPGFGLYGGFAEFIPVPARYLIKVDPRLRFEELAPLTDAGLTPYRGIKKLRDARVLAPNRVLGIFGIGGLGGYAVRQTTRERRYLGRICAQSREARRCQGVRGRSRHRDQRQVPK